MEYPFFSFVLENENALIRIIPVEFFNVDFAVRYIVLYKLIVIDKKNPTYNSESIIPYYISNGQTNKLRANMLYPFMCYSNWDNQGICPYFSNDDHKLRNKDRLPILLKYQLYPNYKYILLENLIVEDFISMKGTENKNNQRKILSHLEKMSNHLSIGLTSVLPRLRNFLDFIICVVNENIINFNKDTINIRCFRPLQDKNTYDYINMMNCNEIPEELSHEDDYRYVLLTILCRYSNAILKYNVIDHIEHIPMNAKPISVKDFNMYIGACIKESIIKNTTSFGVISNYFKDIFISKLDLIIKSIDQIKQLSINELDIISIYNMLTTYAKPFKPIDYYQTYNLHLTDYNMDCSKYEDIDDTLERPDL